MLGAFIQGFKVEGRHFAGTSFDFFTPFSLLTGVALVLRNDYAGLLVFDANLPIIDHLKAMTGAGDGRDDGRGHAGTVLLRRESYETPTRTAGAAGSS